MENPAHRLRRHLQGAVREQLDARRQLFGEISRAVEPLHARADALSAVLRTTRRRSSEQRSLLLELDAPFSAEMTIERVLRRHPGAVAVLARHHLPNCSGCEVRFDERLEEACLAYGLDCEQVLADLSLLLTST